jgi:Helix-turn-helix domain
VRKVDKEKKSASVSLEELPPVLSAQDISDYLHISRNSVYELFRIPPSNGGIPVISIGLTKRVRKENFVTWVKQQEKRMA